MSKPQALGTSTNWGDLVTQDLRFFFEPYLASCSRLVRHLPVALFLVYLQGFLDVLGFEVFGAFGFEALGLEVLGLEVLGFDVFAFEVLGFDALVAPEGWSSYQHVSTQG